MQKFNSVIRSAILIATTVAATLGGVSVAQAGSLPSSMEKKLVAVCKAIKDDNRIALHKAVKNSGANYSRLAKRLVCNNMDMYTFAQLHGSENTAALIASRTNLEEQALTAKR